MRIVLNILETLKPKTGIGHYTARLYDALAHHLPNDCLHAFPTGRVAATVRHWQKSAGGSPTSRPGWLRPFSALKSGLKGTAKRTARAALGSLFRAACRSNDFDLYHEPNFIPFDCDVPTVITVHDLSVLLHPEWHPTDRVRLYERHFQNGLSRAVHVITDTHFLRDQVHEHLGVAHDRVTAVPLGVGNEYGATTTDEIAALRRRRNLPERYLLFVGTIEPRKNLAMLIRSYCDLPGALRDTCPLVLAGSWGWKSDEVAELYRNEARAKGVHHLGYVADEDLPALYAGAARSFIPRCMKDLVCRRWRCWRAAALSSHRRPMCTAKSWDGPRTFWIPTTELAGAMPCRGLSQTMLGSRTFAAAALRGQPSLPGTDVRLEPRLFTIRSAPSRFEWQPNFQRYQSSRVSGWPLRPFSGFTKSDW